MADPNQTAVFVPALAEAGEPGAPADPNLTAVLPPACPEVEAIVRTLTADFNDVAATELHLLLIGEEYLAAATQLHRSAGLAKATEYYRKAIEVWQNNIARLSDTLYFSESCYFTGYAFRSMEEYGKARDSFEMLLTRTPTFNQAWDAQFMIADCWDRLYKKKELTYEDAKPRVVDACMKLEENYPKSKAAAAAQQLLIRYNRPVDTQ